MHEIIEWHSADVLYIVILGANHIWLFTRLCEPRHSMAWQDILVQTNGNVPLSRSAASCDSL